MFKFKQFSISQEKAAMKVGTDGVLLGAWTSISENVNTILDIGTGNGLLALQMAQRSHAQQIDAVEINAMAYEQAMENFEDSDWGDRLFCYHASFNEFVDEFCDEQTYDLIICNPPFFSEDFQTNNDSRNTARFQNALPFEELLEGVSRLLSETGTLSVVIPYQEQIAFLKVASKNKLYPTRMTHVKGHKNTNIKRSLIQFSRLKTTPIIKELIIEISRHKYTEEYLELVRDFYLKL